MLSKNHETLGKNGINLFYYQKLRTTEKLVKVIFKKHKYIYKKNWSKHY